MTHNENKPATVSAKPYEIAYGSKYVRDADVKTIAKWVRADIRAAVKSGDLPRGKYSVRISRFSMGRSLDVTIKAIDCPIVNQANVAWNLENPHAPYTYAPPFAREQYTAECNAAIATIRAIVAAYNFNGSDLMTDYYHVNFYSDVTVDDWDARKAIRATLESDDARRAAVLADADRVWSAECYAESVRDFGEPAALAAEPEPNTQIAFLAALGIDVD